MENEEGEGEVRTRMDQQGDDYGETGQEEGEGNDYDDEGYGERR